MNSYDFAIVGGGILGIATAYQLQKRYPNKRIVVFEKDDILADHQTGNNSGVIHSGLYYKPGSKKAELCMKGKRDLVEFAKKFNVPHDICGKVVVATEEHEIPILEKIFINGQANGCEGIELINSDQIKEKEPFVVGVKGIWVPTTGIIDYRKMTEVMAEQLLLINPKSEILTKHEVQKIEIENGQSILTTNKTKSSSKFVVFCGGLHADRLAKKDDIKLDLKIVPFRGDYYDLTEKGMHKVKNLIYPVPDPEFPFLGVHFTRMVLGGIECGPNAVFSFKREGYKRSDFNLRDAFDALSYIGLWKLFSKHWKKGVLEYKRAYSKKLFLQTLQKMIPSLTLDDIQSARSGVRAQALDFNGDLVYDFEIKEKGNHFHVLNAPSPAATACLSIGEHICNTVSKKI